MAELKPGDLVFDASGRPVGVVSEVDDDEFRAASRGSFSLPSGVAESTLAVVLGDSSAGQVTDFIGPFVKVEFGEALLEKNVLGLSIGVDAEGRHLLWMSFYEEGFTADEAEALAAEILARVAELRQREKADG